MTAAQAREVDRGASVRPARVDLATLGLSTLGGGMLLARIWLPVLGPPARIAALAGVLLAILAASLIVPAAPGRARIGRGAALAVGLAGVAISLGTGGRPVPAPIVAWALPLTLLAAVAEEALYRRAMYGALERRGAVVAIGVTALAFALVHVPLYGLAAFPVDLGAGLLLSWQRWASGTWSVPAATHAAANLLMTAMR